MKIKHDQLKELRKFPLDVVEKQVDCRAIENYHHLKHRFLITDSELLLDGFKKISSIDEVEVDQISNSLFFMYFETDDQYIYHLDKIIKNEGKFIIQSGKGKYQYVHSNKNCKLALLDTKSFTKEFVEPRKAISHYNELIHGNICQALEQTKHLDGDYVEIGVYKGGSALTALNYMKYADINRMAWLFDTFDGFNYDEATQSPDTHYEKNNNHHRLTGWGSGVGVDGTMDHLNDLLSNNCPDQSFKLIKSNICADSLPSGLKKIVVANIDVDQYVATRDALNKVAERVVKGGIIIAEDPASTPGLIGAFYAMEKFLETPLGKKFMKLHLLGQYFLIKINI